MDIKELIRRLDSPACEICPNQADCENIESRCLFCDAAAALKDQQRKIVKLETDLVKYSKAAFQLGQIDMRESAVAMLEDAAAGTYGVTRAAVRAAADLIRDLEVDFRAEG